MSIIEPASAAILLAAIVLCVKVGYLEARWVLWRLSGRREGFWPGLSPRGARAAGLLLHAGAALLGAAAIDAWFIEPHRLEVSFTEMRSPKVLPATGRLRIILLADVHAERAVPDVERVAALTAGLEPDIVVFTGDYLNEPEAQPRMERLLRAAARAAPAFWVLGNIDLGVPGLEPALAALPVRRLRREAARLEVRGTTVTVMGLDVGDEPFLARDAVRLKAAGGAGPSVLLFHYPDIGPEAAKAGFDLVLAGHTHGGQVRVPFYGALMTLSAYGKRFEAGLYRLGATAMYVSRGLGMEGGIAPRVRFLCRPELAVIDLLPG
ncbi:MAG: metallophosphoesterase family protein [Elusimicrobia bacterium]|nr:metallophosphoesterase family protein [Elusimicrobiota bacterium]